MVLISFFILCSRTKSWSVKSEEILNKKTDLGDTNRVSVQLKQGDYIKDEQKY